MAMPPFSPEALLAALGPVRQAPALWLALSGGADSMALLQALGDVREQLPPLKAIHIHHGLHADADKWAAVCNRACAERGIPFHCQRITLTADSNIEQAARDARYQVFARLLGADEVMLLAQHQDDQVETLSLRLLRGTGLRGLAGMPQRRPLGCGELFRPLLNYRRADLQHWLRTRNLTWVEDPANSDPRFARSWLRHQALPMLTRKWPQAPGSLLRLAGHAAEANQLLDELAAEDEAAVRSVSTDPWLRSFAALDLAGVQRLTPPRQRNVLRYWLLQYGCRLPDQRHLQGLQAQLLSAQDRQPHWQLPDARLEISRGSIWLLPASGIPAGEAEPLLDQAQMRLAAGNGRLHQSSARDSLPWPGDWQLRYRQGGELVQLPGRPQKSLKALLQEAQLPAWLRPAIPLIYCDGQLVSIGGRWHTAEYCNRIRHCAWSLVWEPLVGCLED
ncbi:tRNA lysidine(34) synthetase TilS [Halopseudomonas salegens]|uniref:tRNA(Ile)-lysidine synthase n=1 Tax=Halopseudomonas salegens TaxID=1434072 RepID=A0A1H2EE21_9GAMM|nr:tRNA lysidine(34) synthetase TilS [Halopseudomonas salegens]SDT93263.1 tRNA(Ile)-lysidine synthase [Halopseudomonas salegens]